MAELKSSAPRIPLALLVVMMLLAALGGGVVARLALPSEASGQPLLARGSTGESLAPLVRRTAPAVVNIAVLQASPAEQNPLLRDPFFRRYFGIPDAALLPAVSAGSGVIIDGERGLVITNFHVVREAQAIEVGLRDGRRLRAEPVAFAPNLDLAVLKVDANDLPSLALADSRGLAVGDYVVAIGNPFNLGQTVTSGIVSATDRPLGDGDARRFIQTDAPINPGNSGGPLIDLHGKIVGINSVLFSPSQNQATAGNVGIGFAIPSNDVRRVVAEAARR